MREKTDVFLCNLIMAAENGTSEGRRGAAAGGTALSLLFTRLYHDMRCAHTRKHERASQRRAATCDIATATAPSLP